MGFHENMREWTPDEDRVLIATLSKMHRRNWRVVRYHIPFRSISSIRNRYQRLMANHSTPPRNRCRHCGEFRRGHVCDGMLFCHEVLSDFDDQTNESPESFEPSEVKGRKTASPNLSSPLLEAARMSQSFQ